MYKIKHEVVLKTRSILSKKVFEDTEVSDGIKTIFKCNRCKIENNLTIIPFNTGFSFSDLIENRILNEHFLLEEKIVSTAFGIMGILINIWLMAYLLFILR